MCLIRNYFDISKPFLIDLLKMYLEEKGGKKSVKMADAQANIRTRYRPDKS